MAAFSKRLGIAAPIILVVVGVGLSYLPGVPSIEVPPEIVLDAVLPPILYAAAIKLPLADFRRDLAPIAGLSVALVILTAFASGWLLFVLLPELSLPAAIALGAIISPPDAVAATSIGRTPGPAAPPAHPARRARAWSTTRPPWSSSARRPRRQPVSSRRRGRVCSTSHTRRWPRSRSASSSGLVSVWVRSKLTDPLLDTAISIAVPFAAFMPDRSDRTGRASWPSWSPGSTPATPAPKPSPLKRGSRDRINWGTIQFLLENAVFLVIGLEIRTLVEDAHKHNEILGVWESIGIGLLATLILILSASSWSGPLVWSLRRRRERAEKRTLRESSWSATTATIPLENARQRRRKQMPSDATAGMRADLEAHAGAADRLARRRHPRLVRDARSGHTRRRPVAAGGHPVPASAHPDRLHGRGRQPGRAGRYAARIDPAAQVEGADPDRDRRQLASCSTTSASAGLAVLDDPVARGRSRRDPSTPRWSSACVSRRTCEPRPRGSAPG